MRGVVGGRLTRKDDRCRLTPKQRPETLNQRGSLASSCGSVRNMAVWEIGPIPVAGWNYSRPPRPSTFICVDPTSTYKLGGAIRPSRVNFFVSLRGMIL
jgi:hypothetical protein